MAITSNDASRWQVRAIVLLVMGAVALGVSYSTMVPFGVFKILWPCGAISTLAGLVAAWRYVQHKNREEEKPA
jgi:membrane protein implicated in regulation of membrane protease activity